MATEIESKIPSITELPTTTALNAVKNKIPNASDLVKKTDYDAKILDIESKYYNKFTNEIIIAKIKGKELVDKYDISRFIDNSDLGKKIATLAKKA